MKVYRGPFINMNKLLFHCWWVGDTPNSYDINSRKERQCMPGTSLSSILGFEPCTRRPKLQSKQRSLGFQVDTYNMYMWWRSGINKYLVLNLIAGI